MNPRACQGLPKGAKSDPRYPKGSKMLPKRVPKRVPKVDPGPYQKRDLKKEVILRPPGAELDRKCRRFPQLSSISLFRKLFGEQ